MVGRLDRVKNVMTVVDAIQLLVTQGVPLHLLCLGEGADREGAPRASRHEGQLPGQPVAHLAGARAHLRLRFGRRRARVEDREDTSNVVLEALSCGRPLLVAAESGSGRYVVDGETGHAIEHNDAESWARGLERVASGRGAAAGWPQERRRAMGPKRHRVLARRAARGPARGVGAGPPRRRGENGASAVTAPRRGLTRRLMALRVMALRVMALRVTTLRLMALRLEAPSASSPRESSASAATRSAAATERWCSAMCPRWIPSVARARSAARFEASPAAPTIMASVVAEAVPSRRCARRAPAWARSVPPTVPTAIGISRKPTRSPSSPPSPTCHVASGR